MHAGSIDLNAFISLHKDTGAGKIDRCGVVVHDRCTRISTTTASITSHVLGGNTHDPHKSNSNAACTACS
jgi:hypothetical protein